jgi:hypothetical protein
MPYCIEVLGRLRYGLFRCREREIQLCAEHTWGSGAVVIGSDRFPGIEEVSVEV